MASHVSVLGKYAVENKLRGRKMVRERNDLKVDFC